MRFLPHAVAWRPVLLSGLGLGLSFPPYPFPFLAWVALVPLLHRWERAPSAGALLLEAYLAFLVTFAVAFFWPLCHALPQAALASLTPLLALPLVMALPFGAAALVRRRLGHAAGLLALTTFYLVMEGGLSRGPLAFPWPLLGHTQAEALHFNQFADLTGVPGLTLWIWLLNLAVLALVRAPRRSSARGPALSLLVLLALPLAYGAWRRASLPPPEDRLPVGVVQPALGPKAWADVHDLTRIDTLVHQTATFLQVAPARPHLLVWPETALPLPPVSAPGRVEARLRDQVVRWGVPLLTGAVTRTPGGTYRNTALLFRPDGTTDRYDKHRLVPFAERVPFVDVLPALGALSVPAGGVAGYEPGNRQAPLRAGRLSVGVLICFESAFGNHPRPYIEQGADFLATLTQDGWWGRTPGYRQHLALTRLRAIETRRAVVQVSVSGVTALLLPDGTSAFELGWMERAARLAHVPVLTPTTFYSRHGDWLTGLALLAALLVTARSVYAARRAGSQPPTRPESGSCA
ncbi:MAG: apolipoprotein N-acyltransferase [Rhodothermaceae bacterium]|nr:MAG: apolipoprotein N-acyltransferase [Rhodothermaceae bacterium]